MWIYPTVPEKMLMVIAIIFGAHLLPFSWLYQSISYGVFSIVVTITSLLLGLMTNAVVLSMTMIGMELFFCASLILENISFAKKHGKAS